MNKWRWNRLPNKVSIANEPAIAFGIRIGYWPCLKGPFVQVSFGAWSYNLWYGLPSYLKPDPEERKAI